MAVVTRFEDLRIWQLARELASETFKLMRTPELKHQYALKNQMERSSGSIMDNIAEGFERASRKEFIQYLGFSKGSCGELRSQFIRVMDSFPELTAQYQTLIQKSELESGSIGNMITYLKTRDDKGYRASEPPTRYGIDDEDDSIPTDLP
jgi:four helix bundle protein